MRFGALRIAPLDVARDLGRELRVREDLFFRCLLKENDFWVRSKSINISAGVPTEQWNRFQDLCRKFQPVNQKYSDQWATCAANPKGNAPAQVQDGAQHAVAVESGAQQGAQPGAQI